MHKELIVIGSSKVSFYMDYRAQPPCSIIHGYNDSHGSSNICYIALHRMVE